MAIKTDSARLDWMEENPRLVGYGWGYGGAKGGWWWMDADSAHRDAASLREAIDNAREVHRKGHGQ